MRIITNDLYARLVKVLAQDEKVAVFQLLILSQKAEPTETSPAENKPDDKLAADGITVVQYRNGKPLRLQIEPAVRMNILTGVNQTASAMTLNNCEELDCDLVETMHI